MPIGRTSGKTKKKPSKKCQQQGLRVLASHHRRTPENDHTPGILQLPAAEADAMYFPSCSRTYTPSNLERLADSEVGHARNASRESVRQRGSAMKKQGSSTPVQQSFKGAAAPKKSLPRQPHCSRHRPSAFLRPRAKTCDKTPDHRLRP